jgi:predicted alpha/beta hydrolase family esterase
MKNAIIIHGKPSKEVYYSDKFPSSSNFAWIPWLQKQLIIKDIKADTPEMPYAYEPDYTLWKKELERFDITPETILIGHSAGGGFLVRWLSENKDITVGKVILVAPSIDPAKKSSTGFCDFNIDTQLAKRTKETVIFVSDNDSEGILQSVDILVTEVEDIKVKKISWIWTLYS